MRLQASSGAMALEFTQLDQTNAGDSLDLAQSLNRSRCRCGIGNIDLDHSQSLSVGNALALRGVRAAKSKVSNIDRVLAQNRSDPANHPRHIVIANRNQCAM